MAALPGLRSHTLHKQNQEGSTDLGQKKARRGSTDLGQKKARRGQCECSENIGSPKRRGDCLRVNMRLDAHFGACLQPLAAGTRQVCAGCAPPRASCGGDARSTAARRSPCSGRQGRQRWPCSYRSPWLAWSRRSAGTASPVGQGLNHQANPGISGQGAGSHHMEQASKLHRRALLVHQVVAPRNLHSCHSRLTARWHASPARTCWPLALYVSAEARGPCPTPAWLPACICSCRPAPWSSSACLWCATACAACAPAPSPCAALVAVSQFCCSGALCRLSQLPARTGVWCLTYCRGVCAGQTLA